MIRNSSLTAEELCRLTGGSLLAPPSTGLVGIAPLDLAGPEDIAFLFSHAGLREFQNSQAGCVFVPQDLVRTEPGPVSRIAVADPLAAMIAVINAYFAPSPQDADIHSSAHIDKGATLGSDVSIDAMASVGVGVVIGGGTRIGPGAIIESGVVIGSHCTIGPRVVLTVGTVLGARVTVKPGAVIGSAGFGFHGHEGRHQRIPHIGGVIIGDDVEIGANSCIDRGTLGNTVVGRGTKIDNLVHIAHNVVIGEDCLIMAGVGVAGSCRIGDRVVLAGQSGVVDHVQIGSDSRVASKAGVTRAAAAGSVLSGFPARDHREHLRAVGALYRLAPIAKSLENLVPAHPTHE